MDGPSAVPSEDRQNVEHGARQALAANRTAELGLTRLPDGATSTALSFGNVGLVQEWGIELGAVSRITNEIMLGGSYSYYRFDIVQQPLGGLQPNTPRHKAALSDYEGPGGIDLQLSSRLVDGYQWVGGVFVQTFPRG